MIVIDSPKSESIFDPLFGSGFKLAEKATVPKQFLPEQHDGAQGEQFET
jgi:hypothetical protein